MDIIDLIIGAIIGAIFSLTISYFFLVKSTQRKIEYEIDSANLISEEISKDISSTPSLKIRYGTEDNPEDVKILTSSTIKIENVGYNEILRENVAPDDPLRISVLGDNKLYFAKILDVRGKGNKFEVIPHEAKFVDIMFAFLNRNDGVKIQIFHSGKSSSDLEIRGTIIGGPKIIEKPKWKKNIGAMIFIVVMTTIIWSLIIFFILPAIPKNSAAAQYGLIGLAALSVIFIIVLTIALTEIAALKLYEFLLGMFSKEKEW